MKKEIKRKNLFAELQQLPMSKTAICEALQISPRTLDGYLAGRSIPSKTLVALRDLTGKSADFLLGTLPDEKCEEIPLDSLYTKTEIDLIRAWRAADEKTRKHVALELEEYNFTYRPQIIKFKTGSKEF